MKQIEFIYKNGKYNCSEPGNQSNSYYRKDDVDLVIWLLKQILGSLPTNKDWLDPQIEAAAKYIIEEWEIDGRLE